MGNYQRIHNNQYSYIKEGQGDVLLFIHGFCGSADYWNYLIPYLKDDYTVICMDLRGHGDSGLEAGSFEIEDLARDLYSFLSAEGLDDIYLFGHSLGGYVALAFAELFPAKLQGFSLIHSTAFPDSEEAKEARMDNIALVEERGVEALVNKLIPNLFAKETLAAEKEKVNEMKEIGYGTSLDGVNGALRAMAGRPDRNRVLRDTPKPVLLVAGDRDRLISQEKVFSAQGSHITTRILQKAGHMGMVEYPKELSRIIKEWVRLSQMKK
ncbi:alpha/beta fold hydrolase [Peribacillus kribbensis]|uniref:alpha/beta fold hydrolase n=1 Tax=Peribacillus kribbensis TaxID=356658 RepID=UPI00040BC803|nr:alpha/beta fold hydrolase [Peribacillus kribbensis]